MITVLRDATIFTGEAMVEDHALVIRGGVVLDIVRNAKVSARRGRFLPGRILAPGLIDAQVNGGGNLLFNNAPTPATEVAIAKAHAAAGHHAAFSDLHHRHARGHAKAAAASREARKIAAIFLASISKGRI